MINQYIHALIDNIPNDNVPKEIDPVLDGGAFNGIYMLGGLIYLKQLEKLGKIKVNRISGCSIGAMMGILYLIDDLELAFKLASDSYKILRKHQDLKKVINQVVDIFNTKSKDIDLELFNNKFYITYFDAIKGKQFVKKIYKNKNQLLDCILKTTYVPYLSNRKLTDKDGCIDGSFPYMFKKTSKRKILFFNLQTLDKVYRMIYIKNEKNIYPRLFEGIVDTHRFFEGGKSNMCSYVNDWTIANIIMYRLRQVIYTILIHILSFGLKIEYLIPVKWKNDMIVKKNLEIFNNLWNDIILYVTI